MVERMTWLISDLVKLKRTSGLHASANEGDCSRRRPLTLVPVGNQTRRMVETSLEAVALCGASLLSDAFAPVPSPSERGFLNSSPQAEPSVQISCTGLPR